MIDVKKAAWENCEFNQGSLRQYDSKFVETFIDGVLFATRWIPISEMLPENMRSVLVRDDSVSPIRSVALFEDGKFCADFNLIKHQDVTHWRPLEFDFQGC